MNKNIVIFSDGTGQEGGHGDDTNVYKLFKAATNRTEEQIVFYDRGLGTDRNFVTGKLFGLGMSRNIIECYEFIFENYKAGDSIFLFGFSRGAATVRSLSGFIHMFGILPKSRPELIEKAYKIYKVRDHQKRDKKAKEFCEKHHPMWSKIKFLGVWDTVAALGLPNPTLNVIVNSIKMFQHKFHDFSLSPSVESAYHALSIDEERRDFLPTLWDEKLGVGQSMEQVWFSGVHTDVGGGYPDRELADICFIWMVEKALEKGFLIHSKNVLINQGNPNGEMHNPREGIKKAFVVAERSWPELDGFGKKRGKPVIHQSVYKRTLGRENKTDPPYKPWILR